MEQQQQQQLPQQQQQHEDTPQKIQFRRARASIAALVSLCILLQQQDAEEKASAANTNSFHWEEKQLTPWCLSTLKETLAAAKLSLLDGTAEMTFFNVTVKGEASTSVSRGRKMVFFDLSAEADWAATARDAKGIFLADSRGHLSFSEFSSENTQDVQVHVQGDGRLPPQQRIDEAAKREAPKQIQRILSDFYALLKQK